MAELQKLSDLTRCPMRATASNRFAVELAEGNATLTPEQVQVAATVRVAEALEQLVALAQQEQLRGFLAEAAALYGGGPGTG